jgi:CRISP-associated protein Cas1
MGKLDLVSADPEGGEAVPVETKRGRVPNVLIASYPPERVQVMAQGLLLRRHGYRSDHGFVYFAGSRTRVRVDFDAELEQQTLATIAAVRVRSRGHGHAATFGGQPEMLGLFALRHLPAGRNPRAE